MQPDVRAENERILSMRRATGIAVDPSVDVQKRARALDLSSRLGVPPEVVEGDLPGWESRATEAHARELAGRWGSLQQELEDPSSAPVVLPEVERFDALGKLIKREEEPAFWEYGLAGVQQGLRSIDQGDVGFRVGLGIGSEEDRALFEGYLANPVKTLPNRAGPLDDLISATGEVIPQVVRGGGATAIGTGVGAVAGFAMGGPAGAAVGASAGGLTAGALSIFKLEMGNAYAEMTQLARQINLESRREPERGFLGQRLGQPGLVRDEQGEEIPEGAILGASILIGATNTVLEGYGLMKLARVIPGVNQLRRIVTREAVEQVLKDPTRRALLAQFGKNWAKAIAVNGWQEAAQELTAVMGSNTIREIMLPGDQPIVTWDDVMERVVPAGYQGALGALGLGAIGGTLGGLASEGANIARSQRASARLDAQVALAEESDLRAQSPATFQRVLAGLEGDAAEPGADTRLLIAPDVLEATVGREALERLVPEVAAQLDEAHALRGDVVISRADYLTHLTQYHPQLAPAIRHGIGGLTAVEAQQAEADFEGRMEAEILRMEQEREGLEGEALEAQQVGEELFDSLVREGRSPEEARYQSVLVREMVRERATEMGMTPLAYWRERVPLEIVGPPRQGPDTRPTLAQFLQREALERTLGIVQRGGLEFDFPKYPILELLKRRGGVDPESSLAGDLEAIGVARSGPGSHPGLYRMGGITDLSDLDIAYEDVIVGHIPPTDPDTARVDPNALLDAIDKELRGAPLRSEEQIAIIQESERPVRELEEFLREVGIDPQQATVDQVLALFERMGVGRELSPDEGSPEAPMYDAGERKLEQPVAYHGGPRGIDQRIKGYASAAPFLTDEERHKLRRDTQERIGGIWAEAARWSEQVASVAFAGRLRRGWYMQAARHLEALFGDETIRFTALLAALSPGRNVATDLTNALDVWAAWKEGMAARGRPLTPAEIEAIVLSDAPFRMSSVVPNVTASLLSEDPLGVLSGMKVDSFQMNLLRDAVRVTLDRHIGALFGGRFKLGNKADYLALSALTRKAAQILSERTGEEWTPAEVQETAWSWVIVVKNLAKRAGKSMSQILREGGVTDERLLGVAGIDNLLLSDAYRAVLERIGLGPQLDALRSSAEGDGRRRAKRGPRTLAQADPGIPQARYWRHLVESANRVQHAALDAEEEGDRVGEPVAEYEVQDSLTIREPDRPAEGEVSRPEKRKRVARVFGPSQGAPAPVAELLAAGAPEVDLIETGRLRSSITRISTPQEAAHVLMPLAKTYPQEFVAGIFTDADGNILRVVQVALGTINQGIVHPLMLLGPGYGLSGVSRVWWVHNHPGGDPAPSIEDIDVHRRLVMVTENTGLASRGVIIAPGGKAVEFAATGIIERFVVPEAERDREVAIFERRFVRAPMDVSAQAVTTPSRALPAVREILSLAREQGSVVPDDPTGLLLLGARHLPLGFLPMSIEEMRALRTGDTRRGVGRVLAASHRVNAVSMIAVIPDLDRVVASNLGAFGRASGVTLLDAVTHGGASMHSLGTPIADSLMTFMQPAFHGSRAKNIDKFMLDFIGTGEGAQSYGWGLYFTSARSIAEWYRRSLTRAAVGHATYGGGIPAIVTYDDLAEAKRTEAVYGTPDVRAVLEKRAARAFTAIATVDDIGDQARMRSLLGAVKARLDDERSWDWDAFALVSDPDRSIYASDLAVGDRIVTRQPFMHERSLFVPQGAKGVVTAVNGDTAQILFRRDEQPEDVDWRDQLKMPEDEFTWNWTSGELESRTIEALTEAESGLSPELIDFGAFGAEVSGQVYEVDLPASEQLLSFGDRLSAQPESVKRAIDALARSLDDANAGKVRFVVHTYATPEQIEAELSAWTQVRRHLEVLAPRSMFGSELRNGVVSHLGFVSPSESALTPEAATALLADTLEERASMVESGTELDAAAKANVVRNLRRAAELVRTVGVRMEPFSARRMLDIDEPATTGEDLYRALSSYYERADRNDNPDKLASLQLRDHGIHGHSYTGETSGETNFVIYDEEAVRILRTFYQELSTETREQLKLLTASLQAAMADGNKREAARLRAGIRGLLEQAIGSARGSLTFDPEWSFVIMRMTNAANLSTFLHESGHLFLELLLRDAEDARSSARTKADAAAVLRYFGVSGRSEIQATQHEAWASMFERFLMEGRAPSQGLRDAFARYRIWLTRVYGSYGALGVHLDPDIRDVMERLLASDTAIREARAAQAMGPIFEDAQTAGMTEQEWDQYQLAQQRAFDSEQNRLDQQLLAHREKRQREQIERARDEITAEVTADLEARPVWRAKSWLATGKLPDGSELQGVAHQKLSRDALVRGRWAGHPPSKAILKRLGVARNALWQAKGGLLPSVVADLFGFQSDDHLVTALAEAGSRQSVIAREVQARLQSRFGDILRDGRLPEEAVKATTSDEQGRFLLAQLRALSRKVRMQGESDEEYLARTPLEVLRRAAARIIEGKKIRDLSPHLYRSSAQKAARRALEAVAAKDWKTAHDEKRLELMNYYLALAAERAREAVDENRTYAIGATKKETRQRIGKAGKDYLEQWDSLLFRFSFAPLSNEASRKRESLADWVAQQEADGATLMIDDHLKNEAVTQDWKGMTVGELQSVTDALRSIATTARLKNKLLAAKARREYESARDDLVASIKANAMRAVKRLDPEDSRLDAIREWGRKAHGAHLKLEALFKRIDGGVLGEAWHLLFRPIADAEKAEQDYFEDTTKKWSEIRKAWHKAGGSSWQRIHVPEVNRSFSLERVLSIALNQGNEYNRDALREGEGWSQEQVDAILRHLTKADWDFVLEVAKLIGSFRAPSFALVRELTGVEPTAVGEDETVVLPFHGEVPGWYFPLRADPRRSRRALKREEAQSARDLFQGNSFKPYTRQGHLHERANFGKQPVWLSFGVISEHLYNTIHDITHRKALLQVDRLTQDPAVAEVIEEAAGREMWEQIRPWLKGIAGERLTVTAPFLESFLGRMRGGISIAYMGLKVSVMMSQTLGAFQSMGPEGVGPRRFIRELAMFFRSPLEAARRVQFAIAMSPELRRRRTNFDRDARDLVKRGTFAFSELGELAHSASESWMALIGYFDLGISVPTWLAAYHRALENGAAVEDAIAEADSVVRITQGAGGPKDLAAVQRGSELQRMFTMFYSAFSGIYAQGALTIAAIRDGRIGLAEAAAAAFWLWFAPSIVDDLMTGFGPDDDEDWWTWMVGEVIEYPFMAVVGARDAVGYALGVARGEYRDLAVPYFQALETVVDAVIKPAKDLLTEGELSRGAVKSMFEGTGIVFGLPSKQAWITTEALYDLWTGDGEVKLPRDLALARPPERRAPAR